MNRLLLGGLLSIALTSPSQAMTTSQLINFANNYNPPATKEEPIVYQYYDEVCLQNARLMALITKFTSAWIIVWLAVS